MRVVIKILATILYVVIFSVAAYLVTISFHLINQDTQNKVREFVLNSPVGALLPWDTACRFPIQWSVGQVDWGFNMTTADFEGAVEQAEKAWNSAAGKTLFASSSTDSTDALQINLIYDERQKETDLLKNLGLSIDKSRGSFNTIDASYKNFKAQQNTAQTDYDTAVKKFESDQTALNHTIDYWNSRNGAPPAEYAAIQAEQTAVNAEYAALEQKRQALNKQIDNLNNLAAVLNEMAKELNIQVSEYNSGGATIRNVFEAGVYESDSTGRRINVYQFENRDRLIGVLEHELGHSLGLQHVSDKNDIMYYENQGQIEHITPADIAALKAECPNLK